MPHVEMRSDMGASGPEDLIEPLRRLGLIAPGVEPEFSALTGGVASDIWLARAGVSAFVVKRALAKLRVAADWRVPVGRNASADEYGGRRRQGPPLELEPLKERPSQPLPSPSDWTFDMIEQYHEVIRATAQRFGLDTYSNQL